MEKTVLKDDHRCLLEADQPPGTSDQPKGTSEQAGSIMMTMRCYEDGSQPVPVTSSASTHTIRQPTTIQVAVPRYVGCPILTSNEPVLTFNNPGHCIERDLMCDPVHTKPGRSQKQAQDADKKQQPVRSKKTAHNQAHQPSTTDTVSQTDPTIPHPPEQDSKTDFVSQSIPQNITTSRSIPDQRSKCRRIPTTHPVSQKVTRDTKAASITDSVSPTNPRTGICHED
jgi:hypothetical protein